MSLSRIFKSIGSGITKYPTKRNNDYRSNVGVIVQTTMIELEIETERTKLSLRLQDYASRVVQSLNKAIKVSFTYNR